MKYLITADIRGVKYYIRIASRAFHGKILSWNHVGLRNNSTRFDSALEAEKAKNEIEPQSDWLLNVEKF